MKCKKLVQDHAECIKFSENLIHIAEQGSPEELAACVEAVRQYNIEELEPHLQHEEQTILRPLVQNYPQHMQLCITLGKEHGYLRTLAEDIKLETAQKDLADFGRILISHTELEDESLFPLVDSLFSDEQIAKINNFTPLKPLVMEEVSQDINLSPSSREDQQWLSDIKQYINQSGGQGGYIVLFPRFNPEHSFEMASHLALDFFDFQKEVMQALGQEAEAMSFEHLNTALSARSERSGMVSHNVEALLCAKSASERRQWISTFLTTDWPNPIVLPIMVFQEDVPEGHGKVCDMELQKLPKQREESYSDAYEKLKFSIEERE